jgi:tetratricopeptide (TPR) repeat protein
MIFILALCYAPLFAQVTGTVRGVCKDLEGKPITPATVEWINSDNGQKYTMKVNNKGEYFSLGITPGRYTARLVQDGKEIYHFTNVSLQAEEKVLDFDMKKEQAATAQNQGISPEQAKAQQEQQAKASKESTTIKALNEKLVAAKASSDAGNYDAAIATLTEATQMDATHDLVWAKLGEAYLISAPKQTDTAEKSKRFDSAAQDYQKAIDLKQQGMDTDPKQRTPDATKILAQYYNNLGQAQGKTGKTDDAVKSYTKAADLDPTGAAQYYYNLGATLVNTGKSDDAIAAFDKAIAADPNKADAYYQKGVCLVGKASTDKDGKVTPVPGTVEAFNKYLELQPNGPNAEASKSMLQYIGSTVETSFGKPKGKPVKK